MIAHASRPWDEAGRSTPAPAPAPTALRMALGAQLRELRELRGVTREAAADAVRGSEAKISRIELGRVGLKERDISDLLTLYGLDDPVERDEILALVRRSNTPGWWQEFGDVTPRWFELYLGLEQSASVIRAYEVQFVPGLLQTADYARHVITLGPWDDTEIARRIELRQRRQRVLNRPDAPRLWAVVEESALRRPTAPPPVMRAQLEHLVGLAQRSDVRLQLVPQHFAGHPMTGIPFTVLRFAEPDLPDVIYIEQLTGALYLDKRRDVDHYVVGLESLCARILTPDQTLTALRALIDEV